MKTTLTVCAPSLERFHADDLALYLGTSIGGSVEEWAAAFNPTREDQNGKVWHVMSLSVSCAFVDAHIDALLQVPDLLIWRESVEDAPVPTAVDNPNTTIAIIGISGLDALNRVGLYTPLQDGLE